MEKSNARFAKEVNRVRKALAKSTKKVEKILAKRKNYLLSFNCAAPNENRELKQLFQAKNDKDAKETAKIHLAPYPRFTISNFCLVEIKARIVAEGKELLS